MVGIQGTISLEVHKCTTLVNNQRLVLLYSSASHACKQTGHAFFRWSKPQCLLTSLPQHKTPNLVRKILFVGSFSLFIGLYLSKYLPRENLLGKFCLTPRASFVADHHSSRSNERYRSVPRRFYTFLRHNLLFSSKLYENTARESYPGDFTDRLA